MPKTQLCAIACAGAGSSENTGKRLHRCGVHRLTASDRGRRRVLFQSQYPTGARWADYSLIWHGAVVFGVAALVFGIVAEELLRRRHAFDRDDLPPGDLGEWSPQEQDGRLADHPRGVRRTGPRSWLMAPGVWPPTSVPPVATGYGQVIGSACSVATKRSQKTPSVSPVEVAGVARST